MNQLAHMRVKWKDDLEWCLIAFYGSPNIQLHKSLRQELREISMSMVDGWVIVGDFNSVRYQHDRVGGSSSFSMRGVVDFDSVIHDCDLIDMGYQGSLYTWQRDGLYLRLDRVLVNDIWNIRLKEAKVHHLSPMKSDHCPLLLIP